MSTFSDDAYNKHLAVAANGTLVGNWMEERSLREATGVARTAPQRHVPRRNGELVGSKPVVQDTFNRVYCGGPTGGPKSDMPLTVWHDLGTGLGPRDTMALKDLRGIAEDYYEELEQLAQIKERHLDTNHEVEYEYRKLAPGDLVTQHRRQNKTDDIRLGAPASDRTRLDRNPLLATQASYDKDEAVTLYRQQAGDAASRGIVAASNNVLASGWRKNAAFSTPTTEFMGYMHHQEAANELNRENLDATLSGRSATLTLNAQSDCGATQALGETQNASSSSSGFSHVPSLAGLSAQIRASAASQGGLVKLRSRLYAVRDHVGFVSSQEASNIIFDVCPDADVINVGVLLDVLSTIRKSAVEPDKLMSAIRPDVMGAHLLAAREAHAEKGAGGADWGSISDAGKELLKGVLLEGEGCSEALFVHLVGDLLAEGRESELLG